MGSSSKNMYILGKSIAHSKSPEFWNTYFKEHNIDMFYDFMDLPTFDEAKNFILSRNFRAINITTPYKTLALECADESTGAAKFAGGANFIVNDEGLLKAHNVDGIGCARAIESYGIDFKNNTVVVCGTGPTAKSIAYALCDCGACVMMLTRSLEKANIPPHHDMTLGVLEYESASHDIEYANIIINATTLGMNEGDGAPFDTGLLTKGQFVYDCIYGHGETRLIHDASLSGCEAHSGDLMLAEQAKACVDILFN